MPKKSCGGCHGFLKLKNDQYSSGMCLWRDGRVNSDSPACDEFKRIPYDRKENKVIDEEFNDEIRER